MAKLYNLARMTTATTGTGTITLGSAVTSFLTFAQAGVADGETVTYAIEDGGNREIGRGVYTASGTTLTRSVLRSTNSNAAIALSGGAHVFITAAAEDIQKTPTNQAFAIGTGTYTTPANVVSLRVRLWGGGGGGGGGAGYRQRAGRAGAELRHRLDRSPRRAVAVASAADKTAISVTVARAARPVRPVQGLLPSRAFPASALTLPTQATPVRRRRAGGRAPAPREASRQPAVPATRAVAAAVAGLNLPAA